MDGCGGDLEAAELVAGRESSYFTKIICKIIWRYHFRDLKKNRLDGIAQHFELVIIFLAVQDSSRSDIVGSLVRAN